MFLAEIFRKELVYVFIIILGSINFGETMAFWSPAASGMTLDLNLSEMKGIIFNCLPPIMGIITPTFIHIPIDKLGRKLTLTITAIFASIGWLLIPLANSNTWYISFIGRAILGLTVGSFSTVCPLYITEISPTEVRGSYGILHQFGVVTGACLCYMLGIFFEWRFISLYLSIAPSLLILFSWFIPDAKSDEEKSKIHSKDKLCSKFFMKPLIISFLMMFFQQFSGCNGFLSNLNKIFKDAGASLKPSVASFFVGLSGLVATGISAPLVAKLGHRPSWHISTSFCFLSLFAAGLNYYFKGPKVLPVIMMILDNFMFGLGLGPIPWVITPELFPDSVRAVATAIMTSINWILATIVMIIWPAMSNHLGFGASIIFFGIICLIGLIWGIIMLPNTKGKVMGAIFEESMSSNLIEQTV